MSAPPMFLWAVSHTALPALWELGVKPASNQPQVRPARFSRSPMFVPCIATVLPLEQSSHLGSGSPYIVPIEVSPDWLAGVAPCVWPERGLMGPGVAGRKVVPKDSSSSA